MRSACTAGAASSAGGASAAVGGGDCGGDSASAITFVCATKGGGASSAADGDSAVGGDRAEDDRSTNVGDDWAAVGAIGNDGAAAGTVFAAGAAVVCAAGGASTVGGVSVIAGGCAGGDLSTAGDDDWTATDGCAATVDGGCSADPACCAVAAGSDCLPCAPPADGVLFLRQHFHATTPTRKSTNPPNAEESPMMRSLRESVDVPDSDAAGSKVSSLYTVVAYYVVSFARKDASQGDNILILASTQSVHARSPRTLRHKIRCKCDATL